MKTILLAGTKPKSIGRFIGTALHALGWDVWLYSRHAKNVEMERWHERTCDITSESDINKLLQEMPSIDVAMFLADTGGHGALEELQEAQVKGLIAAKLTGTILLAKALLRQQGNDGPIKLIWCAGKTSRKPKNLIAYGMVNTGIATFVDDLNHHYSERFQAYYLSTGLISPSTLGDEMIHQSDEENAEKLKKVAREPRIVLDGLLKIINNETPIGMIENTNAIL